MISLARLCLPSLLFVAVSVAVQAQAGDIHIHMYSLPQSGVALRVGTPIRVTAFRTQNNTNTTPLSLGGEIAGLSPSGADVNGDVSSGIATFSVPDSFFTVGPGTHTALSFQFEIGNTVVQTVLGSVIPKSGSVELHVVVPDPTPMRGCVAPCYGRKHRCRWHR
jgi:hypothetical protein